MTSQRDLTPVPTPAPDVPSNPDVPDVPGPARPNQPDGLPTYEDEPPVRPIDPPPVEGEP